MLNKAFNIDKNLILDITLSMKNNKLVLFILKITSGEAI